MMNVKPDINRLFRVSLFDRITQLLKNVACYDIIVGNLASTGKPRRLKGAIEAETGEVNGKNRNET